MVIPDNAQCVFSTTATSDYWNCLEDGMTGPWESDLTSRLVDRGRNEAHARHHMTATQEIDGSYAYGYDADALTVSPRSPYNDRRQSATITLALGRLGSELGSACAFENPTDTNNLTCTDPALTPGVSNDNHDSFDLLEQVQRDDHNAIGSRMIAPHLAAPTTIAHSCDRCKKAKKKCSGPNREHGGTCDRCYEFASLRKKQRWKKPCTWHLMEQSNENYRAYHKT